MNRRIRVGIAGYGNLGKGVVQAIKQNPDMELAAVFTRRDPEGLAKETGLKVERLADAKEYIDKIDVMILCGGSATDLPEQTPQLAKLFNTVDSFDTHAKIPEFYEKVNAAALEGGKVGVISTGWDPGLFSMNRLLMQSVLAEGHDYTFWGKGVSQGHSMQSAGYRESKQASSIRFRLRKSLSVSVREKRLSWQPGTSTTVIAML